MNNNSLLLKISNFKIARNIMPNISSNISIKINILDKQLSIERSVSIKMFVFENIFNLMEKISIETDIPIYRIHLCTKSTSNAFIALGYKVKIAQLNYEININNIISVIPYYIDKYVFENLNDLQILDNTDLPIRDLKEVYLLDMDHFINGKSDNINNSAFIKLIYYGFIVLYWPMLTYDAFVSYLNEPLETFNVVYYLLNISKHQIEKRDEIFSEIKYNKYDINNLKLNHKNTNIHIKTLICESSYKVNKLNLRILFDKINVESPIFSVLLVNINHNNKKLAVVKTSKQHVINAHQLVQKCIAVMSNSSIEEEQDGSPELDQTIIIDKNENLVLCIMFNDMFIIISEFSRIKISYIVTVENVINLNSIISSIISKINPYLRLLDIQTLDNKNIIINSLSFNIILGLDDLYIDAFKVLIELFSKLIDIKSMNILSNSAEILKYSLFTGIIKKPNNTVGNQFSYLTDLKSNMYWNKHINTGQEINILHMFQYLRIMLPDVNIENIDMMFSFIDWILKSITNNKNLSKIDRKDIGKPSLKFIDPVLYTLGRNKLYSRICQKKYQPDISLFKKNNYIKYWNFTTKSPIYYICPNSKYSHFSFITGVHEKNYCIPCCTKNPKNDIIHKTCLEEHSFLENKFTTKQSRYISNFGKPIEIGRLGRLPQVFLHYFLKKNNEIIKYTQLDEYFTHNGTYYDIANILTIKPTLVSRTALYPLLSDLKFRNKHYGDIIELYNEYTNTRDYFINYIMKLCIQPIILYESTAGNKTQSLTLLWHRFILLKYFLLKIEDIPCIILNDNDLKKLNTTVGGNDNNISLYLYGAQQFYNSINIAILFILNLALHRKSITDIILEMIDKIKDSPFIQNKILTNHNINIVDALIGLTKSNELNETIDWNNIFIDLIEFVYQIKIYVFFLDKGSLFVDTRSSIHYDKTIVVFKLDTNYYPICEINLSEFFKSKKLTNILYDNDHNIIHTIRNMITYILEGNFMSLLSTFIKINNLTLLACYKNKKNTINMLLIQYRTYKLLFPINADLYLLADKIHLICDTMYSRKLSTIPYKDLLEFLSLFQEYLIMNNYLKNTYVEQNKLIFQSNQIGILCNDVYFYHDPFPHKGDLNNYIKIYYEPDTINDIILNGSSNSKLFDTLNTCYYNLHLYYLFCMQILTKYDIDTIKSKEDILKLFYIKDNFQVNNFPNILISCNTDDSSNLSYCNEKKLIITKENFEKYYKIFAEDITNKNKIHMYKYFTDNIIIKDYFKFVLKETENIYLIYNYS